MNFGNNFAFKQAEKCYDVNMSDTATVEGIGKKTLLLLFITLITSLFMIGIILKNGFLPIILYPIAVIFTFVVQIIMCFSPRKAKSLSIPYAISEGLTIGVLCGVLEIALPNQGLVIASLALVITICVFIVGLILYTKGYIKVGRRFYTFLICALIGTSVAFLVMFITSMISMFIGGTNLFAMLYTSPLYILLSVFMCLIAALYLIASIANADRLVQSGADSDMEWFGAYAITLNVIYLFLEVLRLILLLVARNRD